MLTWAWQQLSAAAHQLHREHPLSQRWRCGAPGRGNGALPSLPQLPNQLPSLPALLHQPQVRLQGLKMLQIGRRPEVWHLQCLSL